MIEEYKNKIFHGDCLEVLKTLPDKIVSCCVTSPPYYGLRDYGTGTWVGGDANCPHRRLSKRSDHTITGHAQEELEANVGDAIYKTVCPLCGAVRVDKQIGLEETPEEYIRKLVAVFHEVKRVLKEDGTLWVNIGDSYASNGGGSGYESEKLSKKQRSNRGSYTVVTKQNKTHNCKPKDLIGIPWMLAFALREDGWYLRQDIIWHKPNPMPESVKDRCTKSHEYIFLLSKNPQYYFDHEAIQEDASQKKQKHELNSTGYDCSKFADEEQESKIRQGMNKKRGSNIIAVRRNLPDRHRFVQFLKNHSSIDSLSEYASVKRTTVEHWFREDESGFSYPSIDDWESIRDFLDDYSQEFSEIDWMMSDISYETDAVDKNFNGKRNKRDVWSVTTKAVKEAHFATYPEELITPCILAGCPKDGIVLDPFFGSGTTGRVATKFNRNYIGIELNKEYIDIGKKRTNNVQMDLMGYISQGGAG